LGETATDLDGRFQFRLSAPPPRCWVAVEATGFRPLAPVELSTPTSSTLEFVCTLCMDQNDSDLTVTSPRSPWSRDWSGAKHWPARVW